MGLMDFLSQYQPITLEEITAQCEILPFDIYYLNPESKTYVLLAKANRSTSTVNRFGVQFFIRKEDAPAYLEIKTHSVGKYRSDFEGKMDDRFASMEEKADSLYRYADVLVEASLNNPQDLKMMAETQHFVKMVVDLAAVNLTLLDHLKKDGDVNRYLFRHSINVFVLSSTFMQLLAMRGGGITPKEVLNAAMGALYIDIGMPQVPYDIYAKSTPLTDKEIAIIHQHPVAGYAILKTAVDEHQVVMSETSLAVVLGHHERFDGSGYPKGAKGEDLPLPLRAVAICDVFEALTSERPYRAPYLQFPAAKFMKEEMSGKFDPELLEKFIIMLGPKQMIEYEFEKRRLLK
jgi:HD-GYP domain-containing protein (c-di-GMP phosphodiesterase class II)